MSAVRRDFGPRGGAEHLARIHGTEEDKVNCPFYFKIGACRHGDKCSRQHHRPPFSQTIIIPHMWANPLLLVANAGGDVNAADKAKVQEDFDDFFAEIFQEFHKFGKIEEIDVCENLGEHLVGNVYVKFEDEEFAEAAKNVMHNRFYAGRSLLCEYSPVTDFREARCRQFDEGICERGPYCNFMHVKEPSKELKEYLETTYKFVISKPQRGGGGNYIGGGERLRERSRSKERGGGDRRGNDRGDRRDRSRERSHRDSRDRQRGYDDRRGGRPDRDRRDRY